jgi:hypothetical protein
VAYDPTDQSNIPLSPQQLQAQLALAQALQQEGSDTSPIRSPWQGAARVAQALTGALLQKSMMANYAQGQQGAQAKFLAASLGQTPGQATLPSAASAGTPAGASAISAAILGQESGNNPDIGTSSAGAHGIGQIMPETFAQYAKPGERIDNPADNLAVHNRIIADYLGRYGGDPERIAVAYFSGPGNVAPPGSPTPWINDTADTNNKHVSSYVADIDRRMGAGRTQQVASQAPGLGYAPEVSGAISVPNYDGKFTRAQATDAEGVPSQAEWDAANAGLTGAGGKPSAALASGLGQAAGGSGPGAQAAPSQPALQPMNIGGQQQQPDVSRWVAVLNDPNSTPAMQQIAAHAIQTATAPQPQTFTDANGSIFQKDAAGNLKLIQDNSKEKEKTRLQVIGKDQFGHEQFGLVTSEGKVTPYQAPGSSVPGQAAATGEEFLKTLDPATASAVKAIDEGRMSASGRRMQQLLPLVSQYDPDFNQQDYQTKLRTRQGFTSLSLGSPGGQVKSANQAISHANEVFDLADQLGNYTYFPAVMNRGHQLVASQTDPKYQETIAKFREAVSATSGELGKVFTNNAPALETIRHWKEGMGELDSPEAIKAGTQEAIKLLMGGVDSAKDVYNQGLKSNKETRDFLSPRSQSIMNKLFGQGGGEISRDDEIPALKELGGTQQTAGAPQGTAAAPAVGEIRKGYRFKGGNPADKNSWELAQ